VGEVDAVARPDLHHAPGDTGEHLQAQVALALAAVATAEAVEEPREQGVGDVLAHTENLVQPQGLTPGASRADMTLVPRHVRLILILTGGWIAACELHALGLTWVPIGPQKWLHLVAMGIGGTLCVVRAAVRPRERMAWLCIGLGVLAWALGELYFTAVLWSDSSPPVPSPADAGYLSLPPLIFIGLILLARSRIKGLPKTIWADGVTAGLAAGALSAAIVFKPVLAAVSGDSLSIATNLSYPIMDLIMLGFIAGVLAVGGWRVDRRFGVIALGVMCFWSADTIYLIKAADGTWVSGGPYDPGWWSIAVACATAAWISSSWARSSTSPSRRSPWPPGRCSASCCG
jgi:hypothetical protein